MSRLLIVASFLATVGGMAACGSFGLDDSDRGPFFTGTGNFGNGGSGNAQGGFGPGGGAQGGNTSFNYSEHCGGGCVPSTNEAAEECLVDGDGAGGAGGGASTGGAGGSMGTPGGEGGGGQGGGQGGYGGATITSDCKLVVDDGGQTMGVCGETAGDNPENVCLSAEDCAPGQGCVREDMSGTCRPYCCGDVDACPDGQYCALRPIVQEDLLGKLVRDIPVCVLAVDCELLNNETCAPGMVCTIVSDRGTLSCVEPGAGVNGDPCPCDQGHFCDDDANRCVKICKVDDAQTCPAGYICQGGTETYPPEFGGCVEEL